MKKVLFVVGFYVKQKDPNGICVNRVLKELRLHMQCDVLSLENIDCEDVEEIYSVKAKSERSVLTPFIYPVKNKQRTNLLYQRLKKLYEENGYDVIVAVSNPPETIEAVAKLKKEKKAFQFIIYEIDSASNRYKQPKKIVYKGLMYKAYLWECKMYNLADYIIHMISHKRHYSDKKYDKFKKKVTYLDIPGLVTEEIQDRDYNREKYRFVYAGAFYPVLREPYYMLNCMCRYFIKYSNQDMTIYTSTMVQEIEQTILQNNTLAIHLHRPISQSQLDIKMKEYDVLVSVGNKNSDFLPSKILNYLALNKKIIHFYSTDDDVSIPYLSRNANCLLIKEDLNMEDAVSKIERFLESRIVYYSNQEIRSMYKENTPEYTCKKIYEIINKRTS